MSWIFWACIITLSSTAYQLCAKLLAGHAPVFFITACVGFIITLASCLTLIMRNDVVALSRIPLNVWLLLLFFGMASFGIELGFNQMYRAGAPLSLARMATTGGTGLILVAAGVALFSEKLSPYQFAGILLTIGGLVLMSIKTT